MPLEMTLTLLAVHHPDIDHARRRRPRRPQPSRPGDLLALGNEQLAGEGGDHVAGRRHRPAMRRADGQLLVHLVAAEPGQVVPAGVKEQAVQMGLGAVHRGGLAGAQLAVGLQQAPPPSLLVVSFSRVARIRSSSPKNSRICCVGSPGPARG